MISQSHVQTALKASRLTESRLEDWLKLIRKMVNTDSGSHMPEGIRAVQEQMADCLQILGPDIQWKNENGVSHLLTRFGTGGPRTILVGHADTVFEEGTAASRPFSVSGDKAMGPGVVDMKGGLALGAAALYALRELDLPINHVDFLIVGDEEVRCQPPPFFEVCKSASACLVLECGRPGNGFVVGRKGGLWGKVTAKGRAAHAGVAPKTGANAILALCKEMLRISRVNEAFADMSLVVGRISGGTAVNVVPEQAESWFDLRSPGPEDMEQALDEIARFDFHDSVELSLEAEMRWPPMEKATGRNLARMYRELCKAMGDPAPAVETGGMSDANWMGGVNVPAIDGLGPVGGMDHGPDEYMEIPSFSRRTGALAGLLPALSQTGKNANKR